MSLHRAARSTLFGLGVLAAIVGLSFAADAAGALFADRDMRAMRWAGQLSIDCLLFAGGCLAVVLVLGRPKP